MHFISIISIIYIIYQYYGNNSTLHLTLHVLYIIIIREPFRRHINNITKIFFQFS